MYGEGLSNYIVVTLEDTTNCIIQYPGIYLKVYQPPALCLTSNLFSQALLPPLTAAATAAAAPIPLAPNAPIPNPGPAPGLLTL